MGPFFWVALSQAIPVFAHDWNYSLTQGGPKPFVPSYLNVVTLLGLQHDPIVSQAKLRHIHYWDRVALKLFQCRDHSWLMGCPKIGCRCCPDFTNSMSVPRMEAKHVPISAPRVVPNKSRETFAAWGVGRDHSDVREVLTPTGGVCPGTGGVERDNLIISGSYNGEI